MTLRLLILALLAVPLQSIANDEPVTGLSSLAATVRPSLVTVAREDRAGRRAGSGSGFVISADGLIATSLHVIGEARS